jgi:hypothetical protein
MTNEERQALQARIAELERQLAEPEPEPKVEAQPEPIEPEQPPATQSVKAGPGMAPPEAIPIGTLIARPAPSGPEQLALQQFQYRQRAYQAEMGLLSKLEDHQEGFRRALRQSVRGRSPFFFGGR